MLLENINSPQDIKQLSVKELKELAAEIREYLIDTVSETGGHLASNLGVVELTLALHFCFDAPDDKLIFDVGHQSYVHKILTGRREEIKTIRQDGGISGFPKPSESGYDAFGTGHSSTALSAAFGMAKARDLSGGRNHVAALVGDGALTGGMAFEALNDIGGYTGPLIIVLNDNKMSISKNVGAVSRHLGRLRIKPSYRRNKNRFKRFLTAIPLIGKGIYRLFSRFKAFIRRIILPDTIFGQMGIKYVGPINGHNIADLIHCFNNAKGDAGPLLLHVVTQKGKGMPEAEHDPSLYHGVNGSCDAAKAVSAGGRASYSCVFGDKLCAMAERDDKIVAITAGMADGTGLLKFKERFPDRFFDAGIAEQHAMTFAAGLAASGFKPYFAVYSTFLQRAFDQLLHDAALQGLPVKVMIDRAGVVGGDGSTHQGIYDISYLAAIPGITLLAPRDTVQLEEMLEFSAKFPRPVCIRYPKNCAGEYPETEGNYTLPEISADGTLSGALWQPMKKGRDKITLLCAGGRMLDAAFQADALLNGRADVNIVNACFIIPLDAAYLETLNAEGHTVITLEDNILDGGFGSSILKFYNDRGMRGARVIMLGITDKTVPHGKVETAFKKYGLTGEQIAGLICQKGFYNS